MFKKIQLPKDVIWRWCIFLGLACLLAALIDRVFDCKPEAVVLENEERWCLFDKTRDLDNLRATQSTERVFITSIGIEYWVFAPCEQVNWYVETN